MTCKSGYLLVGQQSGRRAVVAEGHEPALLAARHVGVVLVIVEHVLDAHLLALAAAGRRLALLWARQLLSHVCVVRG